MGWSHESRVEVVMKERARAEAKTSPKVMRRFRSCVVLDSLYALRLLEMM